MKRFVRKLFGGRMLVTLTISFGLVAILTGVLNTLVISRVINDYLASAQSERVARDMDVTKGLYQEKLAEVMEIGERAALDTEIIVNIDAAFNGNQYASSVIDQVISRKISVSTLTGSQAILIVDQNGEILVGRVYTTTNGLSLPFTEGNWGSLSIVADAILTQQPLAGTEIISAHYLEQLGLDDQAFITMQETPQDAPSPYDPREGTAGLVLASVYPLKDFLNQPAGAVVTIYLFNNDFSFVDYIKDVAQVETATLFLGDMRVSTNVVDDDGMRATGTRVSQAVYDRVLVAGESYLGRVFVVNNWYTGQYDPLFDHKGNVVGMLYVGVRESVFKNLVYTFNFTAGGIALVSIMVAAICAIPIARYITRPIGELAEANRRLAEGDMSVHVQPFGEGEISLLGSSFNNMVETLRVAQRELVHKEKLASMGQLAAGVAHELNNPLGSILLFADVLYKDLPRDDPRREDLKMIISEAHRCKVIVADLLNFARQQEVLAQETNLHLLVEEVISRLTGQPAYEKIDFIYDFDSHMPSIQSDPHQLEQVFINLFSNAADAMKNHGEITIRTLKLNENTVEVRVTDTGSGIPSENLDKLFTPFFTTKGAGKGTGLGLAIVYGIIKMHRGQIHVESEIGHGTSIIITLPVRLPNGQFDRSEHSDNLIG